jgi:transcriptional regulator with XRE-family HTH domain
VTLREDEIAARKALGARLQAAMDQGGLTHRGLAESVSVSKQSVTNWTQGTHEPSLYFLRRISRVLRIPVSELVEQDSTDIGEETEDALAAFSNLRPVLQGLSESAPALLDLLADAERQVRAARRAAPPNSPRARE